MEATELVTTISPIIRACPLWRGERLRVTVIANPAAGGFTQPKIAEQHRAHLTTYADAAKEKPIQCTDFSIELYKTECAANTMQFVQNLVKEAAMSENADTQYLIITAGGDGTSLSVQTALINIVEGLGGEYADLIKNRLTLLRLPFGTGNDGSDGRTLDETLARLSGNAHFALQRAIRVSTAKDSPAFFSSFAFNITSIGIDAFITHMTNKTKSILPGNFYKLWIDLACVFYGFKFPAHTAKISIYEKGESRGNGGAESATATTMSGDAAQTGDCDSANGSQQTEAPAGANQTANTETVPATDDTAASTPAPVASNAKAAPTHTVETPIVFALIGLSGHRQYGSNQKILPDDRNVCITKNMNLVMKMLLKEKFKAGTHVGNPKALFFLAQKMVIDYGGKILLQLDGEAHLLTKQDFPITMEITEPAIRIIECNDAPFYKGAEPIGSTDCIESIESIESIERNKKTERPEKVANTEETAKNHE